MEGYVGIAHKPVLGGRLRVTRTGRLRGRHGSARNRDLASDQTEALRQFRTFLRGLNSLKTLGAKRSERQCRDLVQSQSPRPDATSNHAD